MAEKRSGPGGESGASSRELGETKSTTVLGRDLTPEHIEFLAAHAIDPARVNGHVRSVVELDDLPADRDATWPS
jgi:hypothetical protein